MRYTKKKAMIKTMYTCNKTGGRLFAEVIIRSKNSANLIISNVHKWRWYPLGLVTTRPKVISHKSIESRALFLVSFSSLDHELLKGVKTVIYILLILFEI